MPSKFTIHKMLLLNGNVTSIFSCFMTKNPIFTITVKKLFNSFKIKNFYLYKDPIHNDLKYFLV